MCFQHLSDEVMKNYMLLSRIKEKTKERQGKIENQHWSTQPLLVKPNGQKPQPQTFPGHSASLVPQSN